MLRETIYNLRRQPVVSAVTITGTALSIFLIMVFVMMNQVKVVPFAPESNRDRFLHYKALNQKSVNGGEMSSYMSWKLARDMFGGFDKIECYAVYTSSDVKSVGIDDNRRNLDSCLARQED